MVFEFYGSVIASSTEVCRPLALNETLIFLFLREFYLDFFLKISGFLLIAGTTEACRPLLALNESPIAQNNVPNLTQFPPPPTPQNLHSKLLWPADQISTEFPFPQRKKGKKSSFMVDYRNVWRDSLSSGWKLKCNGPITKMSFD